jgi:hypothetical protein
MLLFLSFVKRKITFWLSRRFAEFFVVMAMAVGPLELDK